MKKLLTLLATHTLTLTAGFAAGIFALPILIAPAPPEVEALMKHQQERQFVGTFSRDREDSDFLHWGEGEVSVSKSAITLMGELAPGPDYRLYLSPTFVETEADFNRLKSTMVEVGPVNTFRNFSVPVPPQIHPGDYAAVIIWCETFGEFITSAAYLKREG